MRMNEKHGAIVRRGARFNHYSEFSPIMAELSIAVTMLGLRRRRYNGNKKTEHL